MATGTGQAGTAGGRAPAPRPAPVADQVADAHPGRRRPVVRRVVAVAVTGLLAVAAVAARADGGPPPRVPLDARAVAVRADGSRVALPPGADPKALAPGTRSLAADSDGAARQRAWLASGSLPGSGTAQADLVRTALLDLHVLTLDDGAALAGWSSPWRYVWPRDAAFTAAAFAVTGHHEDAARVLAFLGRVQAEDGTFQARYLPDASGRVPDDRGVELDGSGWALWGTWQVVAREQDPARRGALLSAVRALVDRAAAACRRLVSGPTGLPPASPDYWEVNERSVTLGTAAPLLAGLRAAARLQAALGDGTLAAADAAAGRRLAAAIRSLFGAHGYPRRPDGHDLDAAVAMLLPPFTDGTDGTDAPDPGVLAAWQQAQRTLLRPAGGLAPGAGWKQDGISWTPETALFALTAAASGRPDQARHWLGWLEAHRTASGALPEKVLADGSPAAVAPLAWTAAEVVLAAAALETRSSRSVVTGLAPEVPS